MVLESPTHGLSGPEILESFEKFDEETKNERKNYATLEEFNVAILGATAGKPLARICKGLFVGNLFLKQVMKGNPAYPIVKSDNFIIFVPFGPIQSVIHLLAVPNIPLYNAVSLDESNITLCLQMQSALKQVVMDILTPGSKAQRIYLRNLGKAFKLKATDTGSINIKKEETKFDTTSLDPVEAVNVLRDMINDCHKLTLESGLSLEQVVSTDLHIHPLNSVGQLHMHGWVASAELITDNGRKIQHKNTPLDRILSKLGEYRGYTYPTEKQIKVEVE